MSRSPLIAFDYAIKYLLRIKKDYSIVENFISALFKTQGYKEVKIKKLLDNKEDTKSIRKLAHLIVEDQDHNEYIIEIECIIHEIFFETP